MKSVLIAALALLAVAVNAGPVNNGPVEKPLILLDLSPEEAQRYMHQPPLQQPELSVKTASLPLVRRTDPNFRASETGPLEGHYLKNGIEIENTGDYLEDVYEASQFHGQDGLGAAVFGYSAPESSRLENIEANGNVQGSYTFKDAQNRLIKVQYFADEEGFHQEDNIPHIALEPAQETPEVREARLAHEKAWQEAADLAKANPDPHGEYDGRYEYVDHVEQIQPQQPKSQQKQELKKAKGDNDEENGPPRGFFYSFKYPVSILTPKSQAGQGVGHGHIVDEDTIAINAQPSNARYQVAERPIEVHDAQVPQTKNKE